MALSQEQKDYILQTIFDKFDGNPALFSSWLVRSRLETEAAALQSKIRKAQDTRDKAVDGAETTIQALQAEYQAKLSEIDEL